MIEDLKNLKLTQLLKEHLCMKAKAEFAIYMNSSHRRVKVKKQTPCQLIKSANSFDIPLVSSLTH